MEGTHSIINTIIFDLDGTLVDLNMDFTKLKSQIQAILNMKDPPTPFLEKIIEHTGEDETLRNEIWALIDNAETQAIPNSKIFPETYNSLNELKEKGFNLSLVTMQGQKTAHQLLKKYRLFELFNPIITRENSHLRNIQIQHVIDILKLTKDRVIMVGDRLNDVICSKKVGVNCILIRRRFNPLEGTIVIKNLSELYQYL